MSATVGAVVWCRVSTGHHTGTIWHRLRWTRGGVSGPACDEAEAPAWIPWYGVGLPSVPHTTICPVCRHNHERAERIGG